MNKQSRIKPQFITFNFELFGKKKPVPQCIFAFLRSKIQALPWQKSTTGFTMIEMILTISVLSILGGVGIYTYANSYRVNLLNNTAQEIVSLARFAQQESISQKAGNASGIRFDNVDVSSPFVAVFSDSYAPANVKEYYQLPNQLSFSSPSSENSTEITFLKLSGLPSSAISIVIALRGSSLSKTITINASGGISQN